MDPPTAFRVDSPLLNSGVADDSVPFPTQHEPQDSPGILNIKPHNHSGAVGGCSHPAHQSKAAEVALSSSRDPNRSFHFPSNNDSLNRMTEWKDLERRPIKKRELGAHICYFDKKKAQALAGTKLSIKTNLIGIITGPKEAPIKPAATLEKVYTNLHAQTGLSIPPVSTISPTTGSTPAVAKVYSNSCTQTGIPTSIGPTVAAAKVGVNAGTQTDLLTSPVSPIGSILGSSPATSRVGVNVGTQTCADVPPQTPTLVQQPTSIGSPDYFYDWVVEPPVTRFSSLCSSARASFQWVIAKLSCK